MEKTFIMIKPDGIEKGLIGEVIRRLEKEGLKISKIKNVKLNEEICNQLYGESLEKFPQMKKPIAEYMTKDHVIAAVVEGLEAIEKARKIRGLSNPSQSPLGSIRKDFAGDQDMELLTEQGKATKNIMHASGSLEEVEREIKLIFGESEI